MDKIEKLTRTLRNRLIEYRSVRINKEVSTHINAVEIDVCLVEIILETKERKISIEEQNWFRATYYVQIVLENSQWEDISDMYMELCELVKENYFFR